MLIEKSEDINQINLSRDKIAYITQTTLSVDDTKEIIEVLNKKFPKLRLLLKVIFATQLLIDKWL